MSAQTPVEWLHEALEIHFTGEQKAQFLGLFIQALRMEHEYILDNTVDFQVFLNDHDYISGHLWDYRELAEKYCESIENKEKDAESNRGQHQKTAVDQLVDEIKTYKNPTNINGTDYITIPVNKLEVLRERANVIFKEQILDAPGHGYESFTAEDYYNRTYLRK